MMVDLQVPRLEKHLGVSSGMVEGTGGEGLLMKRKLSSPLDKLTGKFTNYHTTKKCTNCM